MRNSSVQQPSDPEAGISLLEVMIAVAVILLGFLALGQTIVTTHALKRTSEERRIVLSAMRVVGEEVRSLSDDVAATSPDTWAQTIVDTVASGTRLSSTFSVDGLAPQSGSTTVGSIRIVTNETSTDADLGVQIGMPRDLDSDGSASNGNVTSSATMLPVVLTVRYRGLAGNRTVRRGFYITRF